MQDVAVRAASVGLDFMNTKRKKSMAKKAKRPKRAARWAKNTKNAQERAAATAKGMSKKQREKIIAEGKEKAKRRQPIRDVGQEVPEGYLRRQGARYFALKENYRADPRKNTEKQMAWALSNEEKVKKWLDSASKQGMINVDGMANFRKTTGARKSMDREKAYAEHAGKSLSKYSMIFGSDGKAP